MEIPYGKITVYVLTFIAYIYTGYGSGVLNNLRDAVLSAENVFGDFVGNIVSAANNFKSLNELFSAAVEEHCVFNCPQEGVVPRPNRNHRPSADGCGSMGIQIGSEYLPEMTRCCDAHDICYDTCNSDKEVCDVEFKRCLYRFCDATQRKLGDSFAKACKGAAKMLFTGTLTLGCKPYQDAQSQACYCAPSAESKKSRKYTRGAGEL